MRPWTYLLELETPDYNPEVSCYEDEDVEDLTGKPNIRDFIASSSELPERDLHPNY